MIFETSNQLRKDQVQDIKTALNQILITDLQVAVTTVNKKTTIAWFTDDEPQGRK